MKYNLQRNIRGLNLHICKPEWIAENELPYINACHDKPQGEIISFSKSLKSDNNTLGVHFFEDDRYFERVWTHPERYISHLKRFRFVISPDFSIYKNAPNPVKEWNLYRSRILTRYWQECGITVIPTVPFGGFDFNHYALIGLEVGSTIAISTVGSLIKPTSRSDFQSGLDTLCKVLQPGHIIVYGKTDRFDFHGVSVTSHVPYQIPNTQNRHCDGSK